METITNKLTRIRKMVDIETSQAITQGSIFNCAYNELYEDEEILGLIITARCDIHNDKVRTYSYLPVIPFYLWRERELVPIIKRRKVKVIENEIEQALESCGLSRNTLSIYGTQRSIEVISSDKSKKNRNLIDKIETYSALRSDKSYKSMYSKFSKDLLQYVKEVIENKVLDYYFIDDVPVYGPCVINLRNVSHLDSVVASQISKGIEFDALQSGQGLRSINTNQPGGIAYLVGSIRSPYIELIMQRFADLFTRIGVDDPHSELYLRVCEKE